MFESDHTVAIHVSHRPDEAGRCERCGKALLVQLQFPCPGGGFGWHHPRPWRAEPMDPKAPGGVWQVLAQSQSGKGQAVVVTHLSEVDAKAIAFGGNEYRESV